MVRIEAEVDSKVYYECDTVEEAKMFFNMLKKYGIKVKLVVSSFVDEENYERGECEK